MWLQLDEENYSSNGISSHLVSCKGANLKRFAHDTLSPTNNVNKTGIYKLIPRGYVNLGKGNPIKKSSLSTWPFIYKYPQKQTWHLQCVKYEDKAGSKGTQLWYVHRVGIQRVPICTPIYNVWHLSRSEAHMRSNRLSCISLNRQTNFPRHQPSCGKERNLSWPWTSKLSWTQCRCKVTILDACFIEDTSANLQRTPNLS